MKAQPASTFEAHPEVGLRQDPAAQEALDHQLILDQREANQNLVLAILEARGEIQRAEAAAADLRAIECELRAVAECRELRMAAVGQELCAPLTAISLAAQHLQHNGCLSEGDAAIVVRLRDSVDRIERMIHRL